MTTSHWMTDLTLAAYRPAHLLSSSLTEDSVMLALVFC
jgi:hypothetical protein